MFYLLLAGQTSRPSPQHSLAVLSLFQGLSYTLYACTSNKNKGSLCDYPCHTGTRLNSFGISFKTNMNTLQLSILVPSLVEIDIVVLFKVVNVFSLFCYYLEN